MTTKGLLQLCEINLEKLRKGELSSEDFYEIYREHIKNHESEIERLSEENEKYRRGAKYLKQEIKKIKTELSDLEFNYTSLFEN